MVPGCETQSEEGLGGEIVPPDWQVSVWITSLAGKNACLDEIMGVVASNFFVPALTALVILFLWFGTRRSMKRERNQRTIIRMAPGILLAFLAVFVLNRIQAEYGNFWERPFINHPEAENAMRLLYWHLTDSSFPSNAVTGLAAVAAGLWFADRRASAIMWTLVVLWGLGRVYVGIHYPVDVAGGMLIGIISALLAISLVPETSRVPSWLLKHARRFCVA